MGENNMKKRLEAVGDKLYLNGEEFFLRSGTIHYFRIHPSQWRDRLEKLKRCGLNTVDTYIAWNVTEPKRGQFTYEGIADFERFISIAEELGLYVIVRPGPFICAEWEMGGFPAWLLNVDGIVLRHYNEPYLECVKAYFDAVLPRIVPHLSTNGGGIIAVQVENEYGGLKQPDVKYLTWIKNELISAGIDVLLFTSDGTWDNCLSDGSLDGVLMTANFGSKAAQIKEMVQALRPSSPFICMEFWNGWFDQWGDPHHVRRAEGIISELSDIINCGGHFNIYMFSGGTNFAFYNGSNCNPRFEPTITSYDYGAPIDEAGDVTEQYAMLQKLLTGKVDLPENIKKAAYPVPALKAHSVFDNLNSLGDTYTSELPLTMEECNSEYGYILYTVNVKGMSGVIDIGESRDRAMFYADGKLIGEYERGREYEPLEISGADELKILVENMGRVNYGAKMFDKKGLIEPVKIGGKTVKGYTINTLPMDVIPDLPQKEPSDEPMIYTCEFEVDEVCDTFLSPVGFTKGTAYINGFNLGRYWSIGPQRTLYVPAGTLKQGKNSLAVFDLYPAGDTKAELCDKPVLDSTGLKWA
ncbi:MAG: beta-galactosidase [Firmicutes bacterium]|nr:beta-galactosidase [Bacillota bacterium]